MDEQTAEPESPHATIERLEERIEALAAKLEGCRKLALAARSAVALGGVILLGLMLGMIPFDALAMTGSIVAVLGGIVLSGSNRSTANEARTEMAEAEAERASLIGRIDLRVVEDRETVH